MKIVVDANESACGLAARLAQVWDSVEVRRLPAGDVAVGSRVLIERKTVEDFLASLADGRLFRQAAHLTRGATRPLLILEGDPEVLSRRMKPGPRRGVQLALTVGFRIPILKTRDIADTVSCIRHISAQESKREARSRRLRTRAGQTGSAPTGNAPGQNEPLRFSPETFEALLALPGLGKERAHSIASTIGSLSELCRLGVRDLMRVPGIGPDTAARILDSLRGSDSRSTIRSNGVFSLASSIFQKEQCLASRHVALAYTLERRQFQVLANER